MKTLHSTRLKPSPCPPPLPLAQAIQVCLPPEEEEEGQQQGEAQASAVGGTDAGQTLVGQGREEEKDEAEREQQQQQQQGPSGACGAGGDGGSTAIDVAGNLAGDVAGGDGVVAPHPPKVAPAKACLIRKEPVVGRLSSFCRLFFVC